MILDMVISWVVTLALSNSDQTLLDTLMLEIASKGAQAANYPMQITLI